MSPPECLRVTAYGAWKQAVKEGHKGIVNTAGNSDTGKVMLGICLNAGFPVISIVRNGAGKNWNRLEPNHVNTISVRICYGRDRLKS